MSTVILDIETNSLIHTGLDYTKRPYKLKNDVKLWCIITRDVVTDEVKRLVLDECTKENLEKMLDGVTTVVGHNIIEFDLPFLKLYGILDYNLAYPGEKSTLFGRDCDFIDTLIYSKLFNSDRYDQYGKHSLKSWGLRTGEYKTEFHDFNSFSEEMITYCIQDTKTNVFALNCLLDEKKELEEKGFKLDAAYSLEAKLVEITLKQSVFGFEFDSKLAGECIVDLDQKMAEIRAKVNPILPPKKMNKGEAQFYEWPKILFKKNGDISAAAYTFAKKIGATITEPMMQQEAILHFNGVDYKFSERKSLDVVLPADIDDLEHLKAFLVTLGWQFTEMKERDLLKKPDKTKKTKQEIEDTIERYIEQTFTGLFAKERCEILGIDCTREALRDFLTKAAKKAKSIWVPTSPKIAIGLEKNICPGLEKLGEKAEFVKDVIKYLTYKHRRNSILGGDSEFDMDDLEDEEFEPIKGYLALIKPNHRVNTPANTIGANTHRYRHVGVVNIPRVKSLYGANMRALFCCGDPYWQLGFDFASLEARIQSHFCMQYKDGIALAKTLQAVKPDDIHSVLSRKIGIPRELAKSVFYGIVFGAQPKKISKMAGCSLEEGEKIYTDFWESVPALKELKEKIEEHWETNGKKYIRGLDGRALVTRSRHSLTNVVFQSGGALFVKWSIVRITQLLEKNGIYGDPFIDDENEKKIFQMIVNHDEVQYAVHPTLMKVKLFPDEATAKANIIPGCSDIGHSTKGYYIAYPSLPINCIEEGIKIAEKELKMRLPMGISYSVGKNWRDTH